MAVSGAFKCHVPFLKRSTRIDHPIKGPCLVRHSRVLSLVEFPKKCSSLSSVQRSSVACTNGVFVCLQYKPVASAQVLERAA